MQDKKKTKNIKVRDLKPKKDAKGGVLPSIPRGQNPTALETRATTPRAS